MNNNLFIGEGDEHMQKAEAQEIAYASFNDYLPVISDAFCASFGSSGGENGPG